MHRTAVVGFGLFSFLVSTQGCGPAEEPAENVVRPVLSMKVADAEAFRQSTLPGRAKAAREANLAFEVGGKLEEFPVAVGDVVRKGQLIAALDPRDFKNALDSAIASQEQARSYLERILKAAESAAVSRQDVTDAQARFDTADAEVRIRRKALEDATLIAPFEGKIAATYVENFQNVLPKQAVVRLLDSSRIEMEVSVPESLIGVASDVYDITVLFDAYPDRPLSATIVEIGDEASRATRTYPVTVAFDPPEDMNIKPGMAGKVTGTARAPDTGEPNSVQVPLSALFSPPDDAEKRSYVWVVDPDSSRVEKLEIEVLRLTSTGVRVTGVEPGQRIVTVGVHHLQDGQEVAVSE